MTIQSCGSTIRHVTSKRGISDGVSKHYCASLLPENSPNPFAIVSGASAGAINAAVLASRAGKFSAAVAEMEHVWSNFTADQVYRTDNWTMLKTSLHWLSAVVFGGLGRNNPRSLLDSSPLGELLTQRIRFSHIERAISRGHLDALAITVSAYSSARSVTFFQGLESLKPWARVRRIGRPAKIQMEHLLASSAVPFVFSPVKIGGEYYGKAGDIRFNAVTLLRATWRHAKACHDFVEDQKRAVFVA